jgi:hypothetical protein
MLVNVFARGQLVTKSKRPRITVEGARYLGSIARMDHAWAEAQLWGRSSAIRLMG